jgi:hypothetical protein
MKRRNGTLFLLKNIAGMTTCEEKNYSSERADKSG